MSEEKIMTREALVPIVQELQSVGTVVGFTSGVFDVLHPGHVEYLEEARAQCDVLIVGVNSDASVRKNKGLFRPIIDEASRARVVAGLSSVSHVFIFSELNNNSNIEILKPNVYIKAGDYAKDQLSSAPIVESYGGRVVLVAMKPGHSSSSIINKIASLHGEKHGTPYPVYHDPRPALFIDRDGTLIDHVEYLHEPEKLSFIPGALSALKEAQAKGYRIIIVTNQPGIGLGYFKKEDLYAVNREILKAAAKAGVAIDKIYYCPHSKSDNCPCRKPGTELIERAVSELQVDVAQSFVIGDMTSDIELGKRVGAKTILVKTGRGGDDKMFDVNPDHTLDSIASITGIIPTPSTSKVTRVRAELPQETLEAIGHVAGKIGHDFNNLFSSLVGGIDLIKSKASKLHPQDNPFEKSIGLMQTALAKAVALTTKIRGYVRPTEIEKEAVNLNDLVKNTVSAFEKLYPEQIQWKIQAAPDLSVIANQFFLSGVLSSIFENSLQSYSKNDTKQIDVSASKLKNSPLVEIVIGDRGKGIEAPSDAFIPLSMKASSSIGTGYGLSLSMARTLIERQDGSFRIESQIGKGTSVFITLPSV